ncbi:MAG TPA: UDP-N-acetylmuramate dehydrogenase [Alphaproteobacteria bacterium]|nr:UDP-N-acetylmuramate dehydrogenase [Alphaproteobacteria bacterium]
MIVAPSLLSLSDLPAVRGRYTENAPLGTVGWFRAGGTADVLFRPADVEDLATFLSVCPRNIPVTVLGVLSNVIVRDGGVRGVVVRLGREFARIANGTDGLLEVGAAALDANVASYSASQGIADLTFLSGIPGTIGGALRMNAGAYGADMKACLQTAHGVDREGNFLTFTPAQMGLSYRHCAIPEDVIFTGAILRGNPGEDPQALEAAIAAIRARREVTQPIREKTGGSTFANPSPDACAAAGLPEDTKAWQLIDRAGGRGLRVGGATMSAKHCNFMINEGTATAADLETLGEEVRRRVHENSGIDLRWEIKRIGDAHPESGVSR